MKNNGKSDQTKDAQYEELSELQALGEQDLVEELGGAAGFLGNSRPQGIDWRMENMAATIRATRPMQDRFCINQYQASKSGVILSNSAQEVRAIIMDNPMAR